ncbi:nuclear transport factor 2 family protein [Sphingomonas sp. C3-2]|uniref:nuclear transport factor 2 family protein n=1 Tax=Sphingomonas sp. C3-2 TaxID=3062169 RepID=UPI00294B7A64|nr:nuclear transport factor 2 family protein [Sphingomonas sp. C3-2]WOK38175.1 nuclear transport factor 2 family protein [Sphingomonas sp. C3-2]
MADTELLARIDRLESLEQIRQLPARYALCLDMRDIDAMAGLFTPDVRVGRDKTGRDALRDYLDETMRVQFTGTSHHVGGHVIEFDSPDRARGVVYSKNEHETGPEWVIMQMMYIDDYVRVDGRWHFERRLPLYWYATDLNKPPIGDKKMRWPGREPYDGGFHKLFPSWDAFWNRKGAPEGPVAAPAPFDEFLKTMRGSADAPRVKVR